MSDTPENGQGDNTAQDPINNIKAEFGRKLGNVESQVAALTEANRQLLSQMQNMATPKAPAVEQDSLEELWYKDPIKAARMVSEETERRIQTNLARQNAAANKNQQTLTNLTKEYPELNDDSHPLTKKAIEIYNALDESDKSSPMAYKLAVKEAASELEVKPMNKRTYDDNYSMGSSSNYDTRGGSRAAKREEVDPLTVAFAKAIGRPVDDPKYQERLKQFSKRKNWTKYE